MIVVTQTHTQYWKHFQARALEWLNAAMLFGWGCYTILHPGLFTDPRTDDLWKGMLAVASEPVWGMITLIVGLLRLAALYINGRHKRTPMVRLVASFFSAFIFTQIALGIYNSGVSNPGVLVYPVLVLADIYSAFRASSDMTFVARQDDKPPVAESGRVVDFAQRS